MSRCPSTALASALAVLLCHAAAQAQPMAAQKPMAEVARPAASALLKPKAAPDLRAQEEAAERLMAANRQLLLAAGRIQTHPGRRADWAAACGGGPRGPKIPYNLHSWVAQGGTQLRLTPDMAAGRACDPGDRLLATSAALALAAQSTLTEALKAHGGKLPQTQAMPAAEQAQLQRGLGVVLATLRDR